MNAINEKDSVLAGLQVGDAIGKTPAPAARKPANLGSRTMSLTQVIARNRLCALRNVVRLSAADTTAFVQIAGPHPVAEAWGWMRAEVAGAPTNIALRWSTVRRLTDAALESASPEDAALLIEDALTNVLDMIEERIGCDVGFQAFGAQEAAPIADCVAVSLRILIPEPDGTPPRRLTVPLELSPEAADAFGAAVAPWSRPRAPDLPLRLRLAFEAESIALSLADLRSLRIGDALMIGAGADQGRMVLENQFAAPATAGPAPGQWLLGAAFRPIRPPSSARHHQTIRNTMSDPNEKTADAPVDEQKNTASRGAADDFDAIGVTLSVRFGETLVSLGELRRAGPGTIFTLDRPDGTAVDLVVNGQTIGTGDLISVNDQRAVEIRNIFGEPQG